jgi:ankyrin repeat protein
VESLNRYDLSVDVPDYEGHSPLMLAVRLGYDTMALFLKSIFKIFVLFPSFSMKTALVSVVCPHSSASSAEHPESSNRRTCRERPAEIAFKSAWDAILFQVYMKFEHTFLKFKVPFENHVEETKSKSLLTRAVFIENEGNRTKILKMLLRKSAIVSKADIVGRNALIWACIYGRDKDVN